MSSRLLMRSRRGLFALASALLVACGAERGPRTDSQTNWYRLCESDVDCGELSCLCGMCTRSCADQRGCGERGDASCVTDSGVVAVCGGRAAPAVGLCLSTCAEEPCAEGLVCVAGACQPLSERPFLVTVDPAEEHQTLIGFGATLAYIEAQVVTHPRRDELLEAMFAELGLDVLRLRNRFGYVGDDDLATAGFIVDAAARSLGEPPTLLLTSWTPPAALKASGVRTCQGDVTTCTLARDGSGGFDYAGLAAHWGASLDAYAAVGVNPDYIGIQNNPDFIPEAAAPGEGCRFLPAEGSVTQLIGGVAAEVEYPGFAEALEAIATELEGSPSPPRILAPETAGIHSVAEYTQALDTSRIAAIAHHLYDIGPTSVSREDLAAVGELGANLDLPLLQTEMWADGPGTAVLAHHVLVDEGAAAYLQGVLVGPASLTNVSPGMLIAMTPTDFTLEGPYHSLRHFARYTAPGWVRVGVESNAESLLVSAWKAPAGEAMTVVLVNSDLVDLDVQLDLGRALDRARVVRTVFDGLERSADLGPLPQEGVLRIPGRAVVTVAAGQ